MKWSAAAEPEADTTLEVLRKLGPGWRSRPTVGRRGPEHMVGATERGCGPPDPRPSIRPRRRSSMCAPLPGGRAPGRRPRGGPNAPPAPITRAVQVSTFLDGTRECVNARGQFWRCGRPTVPRSRAAQIRRGRPQP